MRQVKWSIVLACCVLFGGCGAEPHGGELGLAPSATPSILNPEAAASPAMLPYSERAHPALGVDYVFVPGEPMLPAYKSRFRALKGDEHDDVRALNPERFAITAAPKLGVRPMVEWEPMRAIMLSVPAYMTQYANAWSTLVNIGFQASKVAEVWYIVSADSVASALMTSLLDMGLDVAEIGQKVKFLVQPLNSVWLIDSGPLPIVDPDTSTFAFLDFRYYHDRPYDDGNPSWLGRQVDLLGLDAPINTYRPALSTEGGTFQATEDGLCITGNRQIYHMSCGRPGGCDASLRTMPLAEIQEHPLTLEIEAIWREYAGCVDTVVTNSISDDGTGHIDMYLKVLDTNRVLIGYYEAPFEGQAETNAARMDANAEFLANYVKPDGNTFTVERIIMPGHRSVQGEEGGSKMPFTYVNSTFINGLNLWPAYTFADWSESRALAQSQWEALMPDMDHVWIDSEELSFWSGAIHCVTRTIPDLQPSAWVAEGECRACGDCMPPPGGYAGLCRPGAATEDVCYGPEWLCACNDCTQPCPGDPHAPERFIDPCQGISASGCCNPDANILFCDGEALAVLDCKGEGCGWNAEGERYDCAYEGADPSGAVAASCEAIQAEAQACQPQCESLECGDDGCGGTCGGCTGCERCEGGMCVPNCENECVLGPSVCMGEVLTTCTLGESDCTTLVEADCSANGEVCEAGACVLPSPLPSTPAQEVVDSEPEQRDEGDAASEGCASHGSPPASWAPLLILGIALLTRRLQCEEARL